MRRESGDSRYWVLWDDLIMERRRAMEQTETGLRVLKRSGVKSVFCCFFS